jgi:surface antigen
MRLLGFIALACFIIWVWPMIFQKSPVSTVVPTGSALGGMTDVEQQYYRQVFDYVMEEVKADSPYDWQTASGRGTINASAPFESKSGATCRSFSESYTIGGNGGSVEGVACRRQGRDGWCRLKRSDALTCAMEPPGGVVDETIQGTEDVLKTGKDMLGRVRGMTR